MHHLDWGLEQAWAHACCCPNCSCIHSICLDVFCSVFTHPVFPRKPYPNLFCRRVSLPLVCPFLSPCVFFSPAPPLLLSLSLPRASISWTVFDGKSQTDGPKHSGSFTCSASTTRSELELELELVLCALPPPISVLGCRFRSPLRQTAPKSKFVAGHGELLSRVPLWLLSCTRCRLD